MTNLIHRLRGKYDEAYRIRHGWGLSPIRNKREMKALIDFCREELKDTDHMKLNPERMAVYKHTIKLYDNGSNRYLNTHQYINDHVGWYWN